MVIRIIVEINTVFAKQIQFDVVLSQANSAPILIILTDKFKLLDTRIY